MSKIKMSKTVVQKVYTVVIIILLLGVLAMQREQVFGYELFVSKSDVKQTATFTLDDIQDLYDDATSYKVQQDSILVFSNKTQIGWANNTSPSSDSIVGFASSVPLLVAFDMGDKLVGIKLLKNYESPDFVEKIVKTGFMESWDNLHILDIGNSTVDAVSGATLTSVAIINTIKHSIGKVTNQAVFLDRKPDYLALLKSALAYLLFALALTQFFIPKKMKTIRTVHQLLVVIILGFWSGTFLSLFSFNNWMLLGIDLPAKLFVFMVLVLSIILPLITNKSFYCSHLCPLGASQ